MYKSNFSIVTKGVFVALSFCLLSSASEAMHEENSNEDRQTLAAKIEWNGRHPYIPGNGGIKHYVGKSQFEQLFPDQATFSKCFPGRAYPPTFPSGYDQ